MLIIRRKYTAFNRHTNRHYGTATRTTVEQQRIIDNYKSAKRKLARKSYSVEAIKHRSNR